MDLVRNVFSGGFGMGTGALSDTVKLVVLGGTVETARRMASSSWNSFLDSFFLTAHFTQTDSPYEWIMHWLSKQPAWGRSREFDITTHTVRKGNASAGDFGDDDEDEESGFAQSSKKNMIAFMPAQDTTHTIYYRGHWLRITRSKRPTDYGQCHEVKISVVARNNAVIKQLVLEAKKLYEKDAESRIHVFIPDTWGNWRWNGSRQKRPLESVVLESNVKDMIVADSKDFINSEEWYAERGIPYRRGYLLYGVPGSGKTSLIHALAGELGLDIYALSLSAKGMSDNMLTQLMGRIPTRCIVLLEDLDASFTHSTTRDKKSTGVPTVPTSSTSAESDGNSLTLSGLLNAIDGVTAPEGRILFATTNHIDRLDEALRRPGRMDVWINFKHATQWQAEGIFKRFFPCKPKTTSGQETPLGSDVTEVSSATAATFSSNVSDRVNKRSKSVPNARILDEEELATLAKKFAEQIPEDEVSVAGLQGFLLKNKSRPKECVEEVAAWVVEERERREKLKKEKEEKERKEKEEAEKKEKEEKEKKKDTEAGKEANAVDLTAARKAYRKAKRDAALAAAASLPTPTAEDPPMTSEKSSSEEDESSGSSGSDAEDVSSTSSTDEAKKIKRSKRKEKWVAVKKGKEDTVTAEATTELQEVADLDTSAVDALVDAATKLSAAPETIVEQSL